MKSINVKMLLGHDIGVSGHYYRPAESDILEDYMTHAADALTIDPNQRLQKKVQELESEQAEEIERLKAQLQGYKEEQEARAKQSHDISMQSLEELRKRVDAAEDRYEQAIMVSEYTQKLLMLDKEKEKKRLEEMSPRMRKHWLEWEKKTSEKGESFAAYYARKTNRQIPD